MKLPYPIAFLTLFFFIFVQIPVNLALAQDSCSISPVSTIVNKEIELSVNCPAASFYKVSETPDFKESTETGILIDITNVSEENDYADISIKYPQDEDSQSTPYSTSTSVKTPRVLVVLYDFGDAGTGGDLGKPTYATPQWANKLIFGSDFDGRGKHNGVKAYLSQNSFGKINLTGEVYPTWLHLPSIETFRDFNLPQATNNIVLRSIVDEIIDQNPTFFHDSAGNLVNDFDFLIGLSPGGISVSSTGSYDGDETWNDSHGIFEGAFIMDIPKDYHSKLINPITNEPQVSIDLRTVVTKYSPNSVTGVWLATDTAHLGTNYYTGGRTVFPYETNRQATNITVKYLELGTELPDDQTEVIVSYRPVNIFSLHNNLVNVMPADTMPEQFGWYELFLHELLHAFGKYASFTGQHIGDIYQRPFELIGRYSIMSSDRNYSRVLNYRNSGQSVNFPNPSHLDGYMKIKLGYHTPHTLTYGHSDIVRLYKTEEGDFTDSNSRTKLIKIPLNPSGKKGTLHLVNSTNTLRKFTGEEYLLLEWRSKAETVEGIYNFDWNIPHQGMIIYHVIDNPSSYIGADTINMLKIIDATPISGADSLTTYINNEYDSLHDTPATFGTNSGLSRLVISDSWNWKTTSNTIYNFHLSDGEGVKRIFAKFADINGGSMGESSITVGTPRLGDFDLDNDIDIDDYNIVVNSFGNPHTIYDYNNVLANYGS